MSKKVLVLKTFSSPCVRKTSSDSSTLTLFILSSFLLSLGLTLFSVAYSVCVSCEKTKFKPLTLLVNILNLPRYFKIIFHHYKDGPEKV